jgi:hypothetical protein
LANYFASLPAYRDPGGLEFAPLNQAVQNFGETSRQNVMAEYAAQRNKVADGRANRAEGRAAENFNMQKTEFQQQQQDRAHKALAATFQAFDPDPAKRVQQYGLVRRMPDFDNDVREAGGNPDDMEGTIKLLTARATGYQSPKGPDVMEVNNTLVRVAPDGSSATPIYSAADAPGGQFASAKDRANVEEGLRKEFTSQSKDFVTVREAKNQIEEITKSPSAGADVALVYSFMKILDPNSVVRETEYATAQNAAGVPDQIRNVWNRILAGERLNPAQRQDFVTQARKVYTSREKSYRGMQEQYRDIAKRKNLDPRDTMIEFAPAVAPEGGAPQQGAVEDGYRFKGGNPADPNSWEQVR